jgi:hypothetical protein
MLHNMEQYALLQTPHRTVKGKLQDMSFAAVTTISIDKRDKEKRPKTMT